MLPEVTERIITALDETKVERDRYKVALEEIEAKLLTPCSTPSHSFKLQSEAWAIAAAALAITAAKAEKP
jgi:hypothetical protein